MLFDDKRSAGKRMVLGALIGLAAHLLLGYLLGCFSLIGPSRFTGFVFPSCNFPYSIEWLGIALSFGLFALLGAEAAVGTLPFADGGRGLLLRSLLHFAVMALTLGVWAGLNLGWREVPFFLILLALVYVLIWLGRWVGWYAELAAIREKLGLSPGPSPLKWKESLPYLVFAFLLCAVLPILLRLFDPPDVPVLTGILLPFLLLPVGGFFSGLSLGRRQGFCPLYPAACGLFYLPVVFWLYNRSALYHCAVVLCAVILGNALGALLGRAPKKPTPPPK